LKKETFSRVFPFALFMLFIGLEEFARFLQGKAILQVGAHAIYWIYPMKAAAVGAVLILFRKHYQEIRLSDLGSPARTAASLLVGLGVFWLWINMDWSFGTQGTPSGFNLNVFDDTSRTGMTAVRLAGAVLVVPVMEERLPVYPGPPGGQPGLGDLCAADGGVPVLVKSKKPKADGKCSDGSAEATLPSLFQG
jgi:CAAX prenyl protease-like protein